jgi:hypothetical protein
MVYFTGMPKKVTKPKKESGGDLDSTLKMINHST